MGFQRGQLDIAVAVGQFVVGSAIGILRKADRQILVVTNLEGPDRHSGRAGGRDSKRPEVLGT